VARHDGWMGRLGVLAVVVLCLGLAGCSHAPGAVPSTTTTLSPDETTWESLSTATSFVFANTTTQPPPGPPVESEGLNPGSECNWLGTIFGKVPPSHLHLLPLRGAILLPGCLVGQIS
jgi:hypothetical protein